MKILASITVGDKNIIRQWEANEKGDHVIMAKFGSKSIAIPFDRAKAEITLDKNQLNEKVTGSISLSLEQLEAVLDDLPRAFLGTLNICDAVIIEDSN